MLGIPESNKALNPFHILKNKFNYINKTSKLSDFEKIEFCFYETCFT